MKVKSVINVLLGLIAIASTAATVFLTTHQIEYFFIFPLLALVSLILLFGLNPSKVTWSRQSAVFDQRKEEIQSLPLPKRLSMLGIMMLVMLVMLVASVSEIAVSNSLEEPIVNKFVISFLVPWLICRPVYSLFRSTVSYPAVVGIIGSWGVISLNAFEHFNIAESTSHAVILANFVAFIVVFELARGLTLKLTGVKPLAE